MRRWLSVDVSADRGPVPMSKAPGFAGLTYLRTTAPPCQRSNSRVSGIGTGTWMAGAAEEVVGTDALRDILGRGVR